jgi:hydroxymethylbilane synthase
VSATSTPGATARHDGPAIRLGTRKSPMALFQSRQVAAMIEAACGRRCELVTVSTPGDASAGQLAQIGGTGVFVSSLRSSLLTGETDIAVHSLKDLPAVQPEGILLAAVPGRDDPRDALVARDGVKLADLPAGARVGTGSPRRAAQLLMLRQDLRPVAIRGNAGTRIGRIDSGEVGAVVLAYAGLARIGSLDAITQVFEVQEMLPAPGQGALAVECLASRQDLAGLLALIDDGVSRAAVTAERAVLAGLEAGCSAPVGAYAAGTDTLRLHAVVAAPDGGKSLRGSAVGPAAEAERLGREVAADLLQRGAGRYTAVSAGHLSTGNDS